jgi:hypothetical protein
MTSNTGAIFLCLDAGETDRIEVTRGAYEITDAVNRHIPDKGACLCVRRTEFFSERALEKNSKNFLVDFADVMNPARSSLRPAGTGRRRCSRSSREALYPLWAKNQSPDTMETEVS